MSAFQSFVTSNFLNASGVPMLLPLKEVDGKMIGTKNNLTEAELAVVHQKGSLVKDNKTYRAVPTNEGTHLELRLRYTDHIVCIDVDGQLANGDITLDDFMKLDIPFLKTCPYTLSRKKKLPHFYFRLDGLDLAKLKATYVDCFKDFKGDLLVNHAWERNNAEMFQYTHEVPFISWEELKPLFSVDLEQEKASKAPPSHAAGSNMGEELLSIIGLDYLTNYSNWCKIVWSSKSCQVNVEFIKQISMKASNYTDEGFYRTYDSYDEPRCGMGTLKYYARLSNEKEYFNIISKEFSLEDNSDYGIAKFYFSMYGDNYVFKDGELYSYFKQKWRLDDKKRFLKNEIQQNMIRYLDERKNVLLRMNIKTAEDSEKLKKVTDGLNHYFRTINSISQINNITENFINILNAHQADMENLFDEKPYIFCFTNKAFDLLSGKEIEVSKEDYITQNTQYDFHEPSQEQLDVIDKIFRQIFPQEEVRQCYLSVLFSGMTGIRLEKFFLLNGCGRNGKGLINESYATLLGSSYFYKLPVDVLTSKQNLGSGANPQIANMDNMRFILSCEPDDDVKLRMSIIKDMTGGGEISARKLFSNQCRVRMKQTQVFECNKKPKLSGRIDQSILERIVDIPFISHFTSNLDDVDETNHIYPVNTFYKTSEFQQEYKCALFRYIMAHSRKELYLPLCITARSANFVMDSDELFEWFNDHYDLTNEKDDVLKMVDVYDLFKSSEFFQEKTKEEKRKLNKKGFIEAIASSVAFKGKYFNDQKQINGFAYTERIIKYKLKE